ncbi:helix-turn-helix transcriptional regulator [Nonomuraea wenchangensis]|uniref:Predicted DNA-binding transcriptional regulator YafY, contains an HTH and WYL domains n=1 Tax=Nonomuraea wenchangensis TaxID=568860 RepID=A0A1I0L7T0_9ACTN|nr:transcriptional regulator [Nonomuraea wenchangensis]SEU35966.1 Predicted DNA-binding transcriptional regulator YafY, contains an HTH and WYL domains [Nonomuraea wenchangensis]
MLETSARLLKLLSLLQTHREWSGLELAERLGVTARTVRRDVGRLRELGYPVHATAGTPGYRLGAGTDLPPLLLDDDEAVAVAVGLRTAAGGSVAGIEETSARALAKLERVLPSRLRQRVHALQSMTVPMNRAGSAVDPAALTAIAAACRDHETLRFDYRTHDGQDSARAAEPYRLLHSGRHWYLLGWDTGRAGWRTYRVDRLRLRTPNGPRFAPRDPPDTDLAAYMSRSISSAPYRYQGRFTMHAAAEVVAERMPATVGTIEPLDERSCTLSTGSNDLDELAMWVVLMDIDFDVHEPPELVDRFGVLFARLARVVKTPSAFTK